MKFTVRDGFVIHDTKLVEIQGKQQEQTNSYYEGQTVDFDEATAMQHAHKLEPEEKSAKDFLAKKYPPIAEAQAAAGVTGDAGAQIGALTKQIADLTNLVGQMATAIQGAVAPATPV